MKIDILAILMPLLSTSIIACIFIIISISRDKFLKTIDISQMFAITKILKFLLFVIISTSLIVLASLELVHYDIAEINKVLNNPNKRFIYFIEITFLIIIFSVLYIIILNFSNKNCYYIENYNNSGQTLYILQKYKDYYICTIDSPENNSRIIKSFEDLNNIKLEYYINSNLEHLNVSDIFTIYKTHVKKMFFFYLTQLTLIIGFFFVMLLIFSVNYIFNFKSIIILLTTIVLIFYFIYILIKALIMNWSELNTYQANRKK
ncbi:hypothetical protein [Staphylococcus xylosus]|uniref:hypothetical protein n=1 Tax=Staphylococcus xylosus TaxID=1288 RepID=UPI001F20DB62|nr:hypothetical protein [Staphylococcus xylosus]MCE4994727.1 hypothetical protein [Staphylococcus xylosus]